MQGAIMKSKMGLLISSFLLALFAFDSVKAQPLLKNELHAVVYVGSCTWGNTSISSCTHRAGNALASFFLNPTDNELYVYNRITESDENFCKPPEVRPDASLLRMATRGENSIFWTDAGASRDSGMTLDPSQLNQVQASTGSYNFKQFTAGKPMVIYAPCFLAQPLRNAGAGADPFRLKN